VRGTRGRKGCGGAGLADLRRYCDLMLVVDSAVHRSEIGGQFDLGCRELPRLSAHVPNFSRISSVALSMRFERAASS
jgi:hypothetical protein